MSDEVRLVRLTKAIKALQSEVASNSADAQQLKQTLREHFVNAPTVQGQTPRTARAAIEGNKTNAEILTSLSRYKNVNTDEESNAPYRPYKRFYLNSDAIKDISEVSYGTAKQNPWGARYRLGGISKSVRDEISSTTVSAASIAANPDFNRMSSSTQLQLIDLDGDNTYHTSNTKRNFATARDTVLTNNDYDMAQYGNDRSWTVLQNMETSEVSFSRSGVYLLTGRFNIRFLYRSREPRWFDETSEILGFSSKMNPLLTTGQPINGNTGDECFPDCRLKIIQFGKDANDKTVVKNIAYSHSLSITSSSAGKRDSVLGIHAMLDITKGDHIALVLERSTRTLRLGTGSALETIDAVCAFKQKDLDSYMPDRDKSNYLEITRLYGPIA